MGTASVKANENAKFPIIFVVITARTDQRQRVLELLIGVVPEDDALPFRIEAAFQRRWRLDSGPPIATVSDQGPRCPDCVRKHPLLIR
jgi:hypothetical protein